MNHISDTRLYLLPRGTHRNKHIEREKQKQRVYMAFYQKTVFQENVKP